LETTNLENLANLQYPQKSTQKEFSESFAALPKKKKTNKKTQKKPTKKPHTQTNYPEMFSETEDKNCLLSL